LVDVHSLSGFPKVAMNSLKNASKLFKSDDYHSSKNTNEANVVPNNKTSMSPT
jgi:hypothetical protein